MTPDAARRTCKRLQYGVSPGSVRHCDRPAIFLINGGYPVCGQHIAPALRSLTERGEVARVESA